MNRTIGKWIAALFTVGMALVLGSPLAAAPKRDKAALLKEREAWFSRTRRGPAGQSPAALRLKALAAAKQLPLAPRALAASLAAPALGGVWQELGPRPLQPGPYSGRATSLAVDLAHDPSGNTVYLGSAFGGVWKSTNGLSANPTFAPISDASLSLAVGAIALDTSTNPATLYVGTGESNLSTDSYYGIGILKSADGGLTWTLASTANGGSIPFLGLSFSRIVVDPGNPQVLLAATVQGNGINGAGQGLNDTSNGGIFRSADGGLTWTRTLNETFGPVQVNDLVYDPSSASYYAAVTGLGFVKSTDHGLSWQNLPSPFAGGTPPSFANFGRSSLAVRNGVVYGLIMVGSDFSTPSSQDTGLVQSADGGNTWSAIAAPTAENGQLWYDQYIAAPQGSTALVVAGFFPERADSVQGLGTTWTRLATGTLHTDQHAIAFVDAAHWYVANDGGAWSTADSGNDWTDMNQTLGTLQLYSASPDPSLAANVVAGSQDNGTCYTTGPLAWTSLFGGDGIYTAANPLRSQEYFGEFEDGGIERADVQGTLVSGVSPVVDSNTLVGAPFFTPYELVAADPSQMIAATTQVYRGPSAPASVGQGWASISPTLGFSVNYLASAPTSADVIYALVTNGNDLVFKTVNATASSPSWAATAGQLPTDGGGSLAGLAVSPTDPNTVYVIKSGFVSGEHLFKSSDGGQTWANISGNLPNAPYNWVAIDPLNPSDVYLAGDVGVFSAVDGGVPGESWTVAGAGLPDTSVLQIKISSASPRSIIAATHGRGAWSLSLSGIVPSPTPTPTASPTPTPVVTLVGASCGQGIVVDGDLGDAAWSGPFTPVTNVVLGTDSTGENGQFKTRWDSNYLYVGVQVQPSNLVTPPAGQPWQGEAVEIFLDMADNRSTTYEGDDFQFIVGYATAQLFEKNNRTAGVLFASRALSTHTYVVEMAIPWSTLGVTPRPGALYGFDVGVDINPSNTGRVGQLMWAGTSQNYTDTSHFGQLNLGAACTTPTPTPSATPDASATRTVSPASTASATPSRTASATPSRTASSTPSGTVSPAGSATASGTATATRTASPTSSASPTPTRTSTATPSRTASPSVTATGTAGPTGTATATPPALCAPVLLKSGNVLSGNYGNTSSLSYAVPSGGSDTLLLLRFEGNGAPPVSVTYNGAALASLPSVPTQDPGYIQTWYLASPPAGAHSLLVTSSDGFTGASWNVGASVYGGVDQSQPLGAHVTSKIGVCQQTWSNAVTTTAPGSLLDEYLELTDAPASFSPGAGQVNLNEAGGCCNAVEGSYRATGGIGLYGVSDAFDAAKCGTSDLLEIRPSACGSAPLAQADGRPGPVKTPALSRPLLAAPNPARDTLAVQAWVNTQGQVSLSVFSLDGQLVLRDDLGTRGAGPLNAALDVHGLASGLYFLVLEGDSGSGAQLLGQFKFAVIK